MPLAIDPKYLPSFAPDAAAPKEKKNLVAAGVMSGLDDAASLLGSAIQLGGDLAGSKGVSDFGARAAQTSSDASTRDGRPDLEVAPWHEGGASVLPWLAYQTIKQLPQIGMYIGAGAAVPEAAVPAGLARLGAVAPRVLGGGGLEAGASFAARKAALEAGTDFAKTAVGAELAGIPIAAGSMYQEATSKPGGAAPGDAVKALALSPFYAALDAVEPAQFKGLLTRGLEGNILKRVATAGLVGAASEVPQEGLQTAMEQSFRPDLSAKQKLTNIVDAAITGGAVGAGLGGLGGLRGMKSVDPATVTNDNLTSIVDSVLGLPAPSVTVDSSGRAAVGATAMDELLSTPRDPGMSDTDRMFAERIIPQSQPLIDSQTIIQGKQGSLRWAKPLDSAEQRPMGSVPQPELEMAARVANNYLSALPADQPLNERDQKIADHFQMAMDELQHRGVNFDATNPAVTSSTAGAVDSGSDVTGGSAATSSRGPAPASPTFEDQRTELFKGIAPTTRKLFTDAASMDELDAKLRQELEAGRASKSIVTLAERRGIDLNEPAAKVDAAQAGVSQQEQQATLAAQADTSVNSDNKTAPAAPANVEGGDASVDAKFQQDWKDALSNHRGSAIQDLRTNLAPNREAAMRQVFDALGASSDEDVRTDGYKGLVKLAQDLGIHDEQGQLTDEGVKVARSALPLETTVAAAQDAGFTGSAASAFDSGARGQRKISLSSIEDLQAYNAGQDWATNRDAKTAPIPNTATDTQTAAIVDKSTAKQDTAGRVTREAVTSADIPEKQRNMQFLNQAIDQVYGSTLKPQEQAQLKQMVKKGATGAELDAAAKKMAGGETVLANPAPERKAYFGDTVDRTQKVLAQIQRGREIQQRQQELMSRVTQATNKAEATRAINAHKDAQAKTKQYYHELIDGYRENGEITSKERLGLLAQSMRGNYKAIEDRLSKAQNVDRRTFLQGVAGLAVAGLGTKVVAEPTLTRTKPNATLRAHLLNGNITGALNAIKSSSSNPTYRLIASKLLRGNWEHVQLNVVDASDEVYGLTHLEDNGDSRVELMGSQGMTEETVLHELIHAYVQQVWGGVGIYTEHNKALLKDTTNRGDEQLRSFLELWDHMADLLKQKNPGIAEGEGVQVWQQQIWADPDEMLSWVMTNPDAQAWLRSVDIEGNPISDQPSLWSRFMQFISNLLGTPYNSKTETALDHIMSAGYSVLDQGVGKDHNFSQKVAAGIAKQRDARDAGMQQAEHTMVLAHGNDVLRDAGTGPALAGVSNAQYQRVVKGAINASETLRDREGMKGKLRQVTLGWMSLHGANEFFGRWFNRTNEAGTVVANGAEGYEKALDAKNAIVSRMAQMLTDVRDAYGELQRANKDSAQKIVRLMQMSEFGINPMKPWKEQSETLRESKNAKNLERLTNEAHNIYRSLLGRGHANIYQDLRSVNDTLMLSTLAVSLHQQVDTDGYARGKVAAFAENPMDTFMREQAQRDFTPADARKWWADTLKAQTDATHAFLNAQRTIRDHPDTSSTAKEALSVHIDDLGKRASQIEQTVRQLDEAPYFHLGRYGNFFVGWKVRSSESMAAVADRLADLGFHGVISDGTDKLRVFMRVENRVEQKNLDAAVRKLQEEGHVEPETIRSGQRTKEHFGGNFQPQLVNLLIANIESRTDLPQEEKEREINMIRGQAVDLMPEVSLARVMTHREGVPGYSPDMMRSFDWRAQVGINALAGMVTAPKVTQAFVDMRGSLDDAEKAPLEDAPLEQRRGMRDIIDEYSRRERERAQWPDTHVLDQMKGISTAWFLGGSMSYGFVNLTQLGATLWPELGAKHGFVEAAKAIGRAVGPAFKIMNAVREHGLAVSLDRAMDAVITHDVLRKTVGKDMAEYLMRVVNTGNLDIGGPSRELMRSAEGRGDDKLDRVLRYASSIGYYTETASRLIAAIATRQLNGDMPVEKAADQAAYVLNETMWNYARTNQGREFGKMGILGRFTPLATQFMQFQAQLTEKLFRETYNAIKGETEAERTEARRYLKGHLAAMTVLSGTLGLPMTTVLAAAIDRLKDLWDDDDQPSNIRASYRNWLASTLGKDAGEIVAHGGFRGLGFDISSRIGEADLLPFSKFLADRRAFKDKAKDMMSQTWGAPTSAIAGFLQGGDRIADGDIMGGLTQMLPNALAAPVKAYRLSTDGYVDAAGKKLPMEPGARDILVQLLGFAPSDKAEYNEARSDATMRKGVLVREASALRDQIAQAVTSGDDESARQLIAKAQEFDQANPAFAVLPGVAGAIKRRAAVSATANAIKAPIGVSPNDIQGQRMSDYANY